MDESKEADKLNELEVFLKELAIYHTLQRRRMKGERINEDELQLTARLRSTLLRKSGEFKSVITDEDRKENMRTFWIDGKESLYDIWNTGLKFDFDWLASEALNYCKDATDVAIGKLESDIKKGKRDKQGNVIGEPLMRTPESPLQLFDRMQFHPRVIEASRGLFKDGYYSDAIFRAFTAVNNFVKEKSGLSPSERRGMKDSQLMAKVFDVNDPIIKINELLSDTDISEQEGFKFLFMGATVGIRNPKAHDDIIQTDPHRTLEYLSLASLLMRRIEEGKVVRTSQSRRKWDWDSFIKDTKNKCEQKIIDLTKNLYDFTSVNSDSISWGTGINDGSFTFRKLSINGEISIFSVYSCGWVYINFGSMINKTVPDSIIETFRTSLNSIPNINIPKSAITDGKYARIYENPLTNSNNLQIFKDAVISLCQQLENN